MSIKQATLAPAIAPVFISPKANQEDGSCTPTLHLCSAVFVS